MGRREWLTILGATVVIAIACTIAIVAGRSQETASVEEIEQQILADWQGDLDRRGIGRVDLTSLECEVVASSEDLTCIATFRGAVTGQSRVDVNVQEDGAFSWEAEPLGE